MTITAPQPIETSTQAPLGEAAPVTRHRFAPSPLNRRRWQNFKANRRGYWSFWIFMVLFFISLSADLDADGGAVQGGGAEKGPQELPRPRIQLARHRRPGPRRGRAADLWLSHLGAVRADADHRLVDHRHRGRRRAGLFRRLGRSAVSALHRGLERDPLTLSAADHIGGAAAGVLRAARHSPAVLLGVGGGPSPRRIPARAKF